MRFLKLHFSLFLGLHGLHNGPCKFIIFLRHFLELFCWTKINNDRDFINNRDFSKIAERSRKQLIKTPRSWYFIEKSLAHVYKLFRSSRSKIFFCCWCCSLKAATSLKRDSNTGVFLWILRNFQEQLFL